LHHFGIRLAGWLVSSSSLDDRYIDSDKRGKCMVGVSIQEKRQHGKGYSVGTSVRPAPLDSLHNGKECVENGRSLGEGPWLAGASRNLLKLYRNGQNSDKPHVIPCAAAGFSPPIRPVKHRGHSTTLHSLLMPL